MASSANFENKNNFLIIDSNLFLFNVSDNFAPQCTTLNCEISPLSCTLSNLPKGQTVTCIWTPQNSQSQLSWKEVCCQIDFNLSMSVARAVCILFTFDMLKTIWSPMPYET